MSNSDAGKEKKTALGGLSSALEQIVKIAAALAGLAYVFGLFVLSIHLSRYGHHSLGILEIDYVVVGLWSLSPIVLAGLLAFLAGFFYLEPALSHEGGEGRRKARPNLFTALLAALIVWIALVSFFFNFLDVTFRWHWVGVMALGLLVGIGLVLLPMVLAGAQEMKERLLLGAFLIWYIILLPLYLVYFGRSVYGTIPNVWGGGQLAEVVLVAKDDKSRKLIESVGVPFAAGPKSRPVKLILETEDEIVILPAGRARGVKLDSDLVGAVLYGP